MPGALDRVARLADGWLPAGVPLAGVEAMMGQVRQRAEAAGRDPAALSLIMMGFVALADAPLGDGRADFTGALDEIRRDVDAARAIGVDELILIPDAMAHGTADAYLRVQEAVRPLA